MSMINQQNHTAIYIHIPFCDRKCFYCDFCSYRSSQARKADYTETLCAEIALYADVLRSATISSIFIGGGTPSTLPAAQIQRIFATLHRYITLEAQAEVSCEANPESLTPFFLETLLQCGVNRLSLGVQSFDDAVLQAIGRLHNAQRALFVVKMAQSAGLSNINIDLMYGLPLQSKASYANTLQTALALGVQHISAYNLIVEERTALHHQIEKGICSIPDEEEQLAMYEMTKAALESCGYKQYEISNYALPGMECRHNLRYWQRGDYIGFGQSAHSFLRQDGHPLRFQNVGSYAAYQSSVAQGRRFPNPQPLTTAEEKFECIMLGLRLLKGFDYRAFDRQFQADFWKEYQAPLQQLQAAGLLEVEGDFVRLTQSGLKLQNQVLLRFME